MILKKGETVLRHWFMDGGRTLAFAREALEVSREGFHAWRGRPTGTREPHDAKLVMAVETSFKASDRAYGARCVWRDALGLRPAACTSIELVNATGSGAAARPESGFSGRWAEPEGLADVTDIWAAGVWLSVASRHGLSDQWGGPRWKVSSQR